MLRFDILFLLAAISEKTLSRQDFISKLSRGQFVFTSYTNLEFSEFEGNGLKSQIVSDPKSDDPFERDPGLVLENISSKYYVFLTKPADLGGCRPIS